MIMLINLDNIKLEEYDLYTQDTETILNKKFMEGGIVTGKQIGRAHV